MTSNSVSSNEKFKIASNLLLLAPPCEFNEVFTDVRVLVNDDDMLKEKITPIFGQYNKEQFVQAKLPDKDYRTLITKYGDLGNGRFLDPRSLMSFKFDHLKRSATELLSADVEFKDIESIRKCIEQKVVDYVDQHYRFGATSIYSKERDGQSFIIICIESHYSKTYTSGRWRSEWTVNLKKPSDGGDIDVTGIVKIQTHIFEDGNVQLITSKNLDFNVKNTTNYEQLAKEVSDKILKFENSFQEAIGNNLKNISNTTFKSLRRQLPITQNKIDWNKIVGYKIGGDLFRSS